MEPSTYNFLIIINRRRNSSTASETADTPGRLYQSHGPTRSWAWMRRNISLLLSKPRPRSATNKMKTRINQFSSPNFLSNHVVLRGQTAKGGKQQKKKHFHKICEVCVQVVTSLQFEHWFNFLTNVCINGSWSCIRLIWLAVWRRSLPINQSEQTHWLSLHE